MITTLVYVVLILAIIAIARTVRIFELLDELRGERDTQEINRSDNRFNGFMLLVFLIATIVYFLYVTLKYKRFILPVSASEHGVGIDNMLYVNFLIIIIVFFITQVLLFYFGYRYQYKKENKALFFPDSHKVEIIWTAIPAIVLIALVVYGLVQWNKIMSPAPKDAVIIELYAKQFDWTARYAGSDNNLGKTDFKMIESSNPLGIDASDVHSGDDIIAKELHLPVNTPVLLVMHSRDVIHSAYLPHFRTQMNCVPGMTTQFHLTPTITTEEMRKITKNNQFDYVLLCNKICGVAHFNMSMKVVCETKEEYQKWLGGQKTFADNMKVSDEKTSNSILVSK